MPNLRKRSSVLTYNDDAVFRAIEALRKFGGKPTPKPEPVAPEEDQIPEFVYADDGRKFYPCYFCCRAFALKNDHLTHMQVCPFRIVLPALPLQKQEVDEDSFTDDNKIMANKMETNGIRTSKMLKGMSKRFNLKPASLLKTTAPIKVSTRAKSNISKPQIKRVAASKGQFASKPLMNIKIEPGVTVTKPKKVIAKLKAKNKAFGLKTNTKRLVQNVHHRGFAANVKTKIAKKMQSKSSFPKIKIEPTVTEEKIQTPSRKDYSRILVSKDKLREFDEMYKNSAMTNCTLCDKPVVKVRWARHLLTHAKEKNYVCAFCSKEFGRKDHRDIHERIHDKERNGGVTNEAGS